MKIKLYILFILFSSFAFAQTINLFEEGNALYNTQDYSGAIDKYKAVLDGKTHSPELYFNLANAYYKTNQIAPSIYYYEKALQLAPNDSGIKNNLAFANNMTVDAIEVLPEIGFTKFIKKITNTFTFDGWARLSVGFLLGFVILFIYYYFSTETNPKRFSFIGSFVALGLMCFALVFAFKSYNNFKTNTPAIVFAQESKVNSEPNLSSDEAFVLHEGTKVFILETVNDWNKIKIANGKTGWILNEDIKTLRE